MRTLVVLFITAVISVGCGQKKAPNVTPTKPQVQATRATIEPNEVNPKAPSVIPTNPQAATAEETAEVDPNEALVRARAARIEAEKAEKEAKAKVVKNDTPAMREARKQIQREADKEKKLQQKNAENFSLAAVRDCSSGDLAELNVHGRAVGKPKLITSSYFKAIATNPYDFSVDIYDEKGVAIERLCAKATVSLFRKRNIWLDGNDAQYFWQAKAITPDDFVWMSQPFTFRMNASDASNGRLAQFATWVIQLQKVQVPR